LEIPPRDVVLIPIPPAKDAAAYPTLPNEPEIVPMPDDLIFELPRYIPLNTPPPIPTIGGFPSI